jgi:hypothetical protein
VQEYTKAGICSVWRVFSKINQNKEVSRVRIGVFFIRTQ